MGMMNKKDKSAARNLHLEEQWEENQTKAIRELDVHNEKSK